MKKLLIVTDAWYPQVNGVVRVTDTLSLILKARGYEVCIIEPSRFFTIPTPMYPEIRLAVFPWLGVRRTFKDFKPDAVHIMTEGPLGLAARGYCKRHAMPFTTWYHTHFALYIDMRFRGLLVPLMAVLRWFHNAAISTLVSTQSLKGELEAQGFTKLSVIPLGVDTERFAPSGSVPADMAHMQKPVFTFFSRLAPEKSPKEFLKLKLPGTKLVIGDGPDRKKLEHLYGIEYGGDSIFVGYKRGQELVDYLSASDVMVFPSRTETFGLVVLEALACGTPVAAHNVMGPRDIITEGKDGYLGADLQEAALKCLNLKREECRHKALQYSWEKSADSFLSHLVPIQ